MEQRGATIDRPANGLSAGAIVAIGLAVLITIGAAVGWALYRHAADRSLHIVFALSAPESAGLEWVVAEFRRAFPHYRVRLSPLEQPPAPATAAGERPAAAGERPATAGERTAADWRRDAADVYVLADQALWRSLLATAVAGRLAVGDGRALPPAFLSVYRVGDPAAGSADAPASTAVAVAEIGALPVLWSPYGVFFNRAQVGPAAAAAGTATSLWEWDQLLAIVAALRRSATTTGTTPVAGTTTATSTTSVATAATTTTATAAATAASHPIAIPASATGRWAFVADLIDANAPARAVTSALEGDDSGSFFGDLLRRGAIHPASQQFTDADVAAMLVDGRLALAIAPLTLRAAIAVEDSPAIGFVALPTAGGRAPVVGGRIVAVGPTAAGAAKPVARDWLAFVAGAAVQEGWVAHAGTRVSLAPLHRDARFADQDGFTAAGLSRVARRVHAE